MLMATAEELRIVEMEKGSVRLPTACRSCQRVHSNVDRPDNHQAAEITRRRAAQHATHDDQDYV